MEGSERIGNGDREAAVAALKVHQQEGRLDPAEYEERALKARQSRTWAQLYPLFTDLPQPKPFPGSGASTAGPGVAGSGFGGTGPAGSVPTDAGSVSAGPAGASPPAPVQPGWTPTSGSVPASLSDLSSTDPVVAQGGHRGLIPEPYAAMVMAASPILALILFLSTGEWEWWLAIPLLGIIAYGPDGHSGDRHRNRNRRDRRGH